MAKPKRDTSDINAPIAGKPFPNTLILCTMAAISVLMKFTRFFNLTSKAVVSLGVSRISGGAYGTVVSLIREASQKAQMIQNHQVQKVETEEISADEMWSFVEKNRKTAKQRK